MKKLEEYLNRIDENRDLLANFMQIDGAPAYTVKIRANMYGGKYYEDSISKFGTFFADSKESLLNAIKGKMRNEFINYLKSKKNKSGGRGMFLKNDSFDFIDKLKINDIEESKGLYIKEGKKIFTDKGIMTVGEFMQSYKQQG